MSTMDEKEQTYRGLIKRKDFYALKRGSIAKIGDFYWDERRGSWRPITVEKEIPEDIRVARKINVPQHYRVLADEENVLLGDLYFSPFHEEFVPAAGIGSCKAEEFGKMVVRPYKPKIEETQSHQSPDFGTWS